MNHPIQQQLLELSKRLPLEKMGLRQIGKLIGVDHPQQVKYHLGKIGLIREKDQTPGRKKSLAPPVDPKVVSLPIYGLANCGEATFFADNQIQGLLPVSKRLLPKGADFESLFAVKAVGSSMDLANIDGKNIEDGDYVIIDGKDKIAKSGDYVLSIIGGLANIKKYTEDNQNNQVVLQSESKKYYPPIHIHQEDLDGYLINGKVIEVMKTPKEETLSYEPIF